MIAPVAPANQFEAVTLFCHNNIEELTHSVLAPLLQGRTELKPEFFLALLENSPWKAHVVVVNHHDAVIGVLYAKERLLFGIPTGIIYADGTLNNMILALPEDREEVFRCAINHLLHTNGVRGIRLRVAARGFEQKVIREISTGFSIQENLLPNAYHATVPLPGSFDEYLASFHYRTRRNFRYYRRRCASAGSTFSEVLSWSEFEQAARRLAANCSMASAPQDIARAVKVVSTADTPVLCGLRDRDGKLLTVSGGWRDGARVILFCQWNNDKAFPRDSLSLVHRSYLVEMLIREDVRELVLWAGTSAPLSRYALPLPTLQVFLDNPSFGWRAVRSFLSVVGPHLPGRFTRDLGWIVSSQLPEILRPKSEQDGDLPFHLQDPTGPEVL